MDNMKTTEIYAKVEANHEEEDHHHPPSTYETHLGAHRQYLRDMMLGVNDGLVSTFLLIVAVAAGGLSSTDILLTATAGAVAGAISMCAGEYIATKSQNEVLDGELRLEEEHCRKFTEYELKELGDSLLPMIGIQDPIIKECLIQHYRGDTAALLKVMKALEFGVVDAEVRSPIKAGAYSFLLFISGSLPSVIPFLFIDDPMTGVIVSAGVVIVCLMVVGAGKTWATRGVFWIAAAENLIVATVGGSLAYGVGYLFDYFVNK